jgi:hypothetical protein
MCKVMLGKKNFEDDISILLYQYYETVPLLFFYFLDIHTTWFTDLI